MKSIPGGKTWERVFLGVPSELGAVDELGPVDELGHINELELVAIWQVRQKRVRNCHIGMTSLMNGPLVNL